MNIKGLIKAMIDYLVIFYNTPPPPHTAKPVSFYHVLCCVFLSKFSACIQLVTHEGLDSNDCV